jgi:hypothetical protein
MKKNIENIEAIGIERDLAGLPIAWVPTEFLSVNATPEQKRIVAQIREATTNVRRNQAEGMVLPLDYDQAGKPRFDFKLLSTGGTRQFNTNDVITRYDNRIAMTLLADFMMLGQQKVGSFSLVDSRTNLFSSAIGAVLDIACDVVNNFAIPRLIRLNDFNVTEFPKWKRGAIGNVDLDVLSKFILTLAQSGYPMFPSPDGKLEEYLQKVAHIPFTPEDTKRNKRLVPKSKPNGQKTEIPANPLQMPGGVVNDRTPADGQPKPATVTTNISGNTEQTSRKPNPQDENQFTRFGPQGI